jgi:hypothetical protein
MGSWLRRCDGVAFGLVTHVFDEAEGRTFAASSGRSLFAEVVRYTREAGL